MNSLQEIYTEWANNLSFRNELKKNPEQALRHAGFEVSKEDLKKIYAIIDADHNDNGELEDRINK